MAPLGERFSQDAVRMTKYHLPALFEKLRDHLATICYYRLKKDNVTGQGEDGRGVQFLKKNRMGILLLQESGLLLRCTPVVECSPGQGAEVFDRLTALPGYSKKFGGKVIFQFPVNKREVKSCI